jgi:hypothetical protein
LGASDRGLVEFRKFGFEIVEGDVWELSPSMNFFAGSVNRRALEEIISEFEQREGVRINTVYEGCGILTSNMRTMKQSQQSGFPDAYMACDVYYLDVVRDWFQDAVNISDLRIWQNREFAWRWGSLTSALSESCPADYFKTPDCMSGWSGAMSLRKRPIPRCSSLASRREHRMPCWLMRATRLLSENGSK